MVPDGRESACTAGDGGSIPCSGRPPGEGNGYPLQYSCLGNPRQRSLVGYSPWGRNIPGVGLNWATNTFILFFYSAQPESPLGQHLLFLMGQRYHTEIKTSGRHVPIPRPKRFLPDQFWLWFHTTQAAPSHVAAITAQAMASPPVITHRRKENSQDTGPCVPP